MAPPRPSRSQRRQAMLSSATPTRPACTPPPSTWQQLANRLQRSSPSTRSIPPGRRSPRSHSSRSFTAPPGRQHRALRSASSTTCGRGWLCSPWLSSALSGWCSIVGADLETPLGLLGLLAVPAAVLVWLRFPPPLSRRGAVLSLALRCAVLLSIALAL